MSPVLINCTWWLLTKELPILKSWPFRKYPTALKNQAYEDDKLVCNDCLSGACCSSEGPIYLSSFDAFRLAAFFDMPLASFLLKFTQDKFAGEDSDKTRRPAIDDPDCSTITFLRRRENFHLSPCIFLKYTRDPDGNPRRLCGVYDARPLPCREFYFDGCKTRVTGELASLVAEGFEKVRDGIITEQTVDAQLAQISPHDPSKATVAETMRYCFWMEMKRATNMEQANTEGADSYNIGDFQDPIDEKLNRILSAKYLRFEEEYGLRDSPDHLTPYTSGRGFAGSAEYERVLSVLSSAPATGLYSSGDFSHSAGVRTMVPGFEHSQVFKTIPDSEIDRFLQDIPPDALFPNHISSEVRACTLRDVYESVLKGYNHLIRFCSRIATLDEVVGDEPGEAELELLRMLIGFQTSLNPYIARNPYFEPVRNHLANRAVGYLEDQAETACASRDKVNILRLYVALQVIEGGVPRESHVRMDDLKRVLNLSAYKGSFTISTLNNPIEMRRASKKSLTIRRAWDEWREQITYMPHLSLVFPDEVDLAHFYHGTMDCLGKLSPNKGYREHLFQIVAALIDSLTHHNQMPIEHLPYQDTIERLKEYAEGLLKNVSGEDLTRYSPGILKFLSRAYKGLGLGYNHDPLFGRAVFGLLNQQCPDGSWGTEAQADKLPDAQGEYLTFMYRTTWDCIDLLRPLQNDMHCLGNATLGLV